MGRHPLAQEEAQEAQYHRIERDVYHLRDVTAVHLFAREQTGHGQADGHAGEEQSRTSCDTHVLGVHRDVCRGHAVGYREQQQVYAQGDALEQYETVQGDGRARNRLLPGRPDAAGADKAGHTAAQGGDEDDVERHVVVHEQTGHRAEGHGDVVGQSVVAHGFPAPGRGRDVDDYRVARHRHGPERESVHYAQDDEHQHRPGDDIASENQGKYQKCYQVQRLAGKCVQQVARERTDGQSGHRVAGENRSHSPLGDSELFN